MHRANNARTGEFDAEGVPTLDDPRMQLVVVGDAGIGFAVGDGLLVYGGYDQVALQGYDVPGREPLWSVMLLGETVPYPAIAGGMVYVEAGDQQLFALDAVSGRRRWWLRFEQGTPASPAVVGETLYVVTTGGLFRVDARRATARMLLPTGAAIDDPTPAAVHGDVLCFVSVDRELHAFDLARERSIWRRGFHAARDEVPLIAGDVVVCARYEDLSTPEALMAGSHREPEMRPALAAFDLGTGAGRWRVSDVWLRPVAAGGLLCATDATRRVAAYELATGFERRSVTLVSDHAVCLAAARGVLYVGCTRLGHWSGGASQPDESWLVALELATGVERWRYPLERIRDAAVVGGVVVVAGAPREDDRVVGLEEQAWRRGGSRRAPAIELLVAPPTRPQVSAVCAVCDSAGDGTTMRDVWRELAARGLIPADWVDAPEREFAEECYGGIGGAHGDEPPTRAAIVAIASDPTAILAAERSARACLRALEPWGAAQPTVIEWHAEDNSVWRMIPRVGNDPCRLCYLALIEALDALFIDVEGIESRWTGGEVEFGEKGLNGLLEHQAAGRDLWAEATKRDARVPASMPIAVAGQRFAELANPYEPLASIWAAGCAVLGLRNDALELWTPPER